MLTRYAAPARLETLCATGRGADVVYAVLRHRDDESLQRVGTGGFTTSSAGAGRPYYAASAGDFHLMDRFAWSVRSCACRAATASWKGLYAWVGFESVAVPYVPRSAPTAPALQQAAAWWGLGLAGLTAFSVWPLRAVIAMRRAGAGRAWATAPTSHGDVPAARPRRDGWTTIVSLMLFAGIQLLSLGVSGPSTWGRILRRSQGRPLYLVKRELGQADLHIPNRAGPAPATG